MHSHWSVRNDNRNYLVRRSASHAFPDAPRPLGDAERRDLHSHAGWYDPRRLDDYFYAA